MPDNLFLCCCLVIITPKLYTQRQIEIVPFDQVTRRLSKLTIEKNVQHDDFPPSTEMALNTQLFKKLTSVVSPCTASYVYLSPKICHWTRYEL